MKRTALAALLPLSLCWGTTANAQQTQQPPVAQTPTQPQSQAQPPRITTVIDPQTVRRDENSDQRLNNDRYVEPQLPDSMRRDNCRGSWRLFKIRLRCGI